MINTKNLSPFVQAALSLDQTLDQFERLAREMDDVTIDSDRGFERARKLLTQTDEIRQKISEGMQELGRTLEQTRERMDRCATALTDRATIVNERQKLAEGMLERFRSLGEMVRQVTTLVGQFKQASDVPMTDEDKELLKQSLPQFNTQLGVLVEEARKLMLDAQEANMKTLEKSADALRQSLQSAQNRLNQFGETPKSSSLDLH